MPHLLYARSKENILEDTMEGRSAKRRKPNDDNRSPAIGQLSENDPEENDFWETARLYANVGDVSRTDGDVLASSSKRKRAHPIQGKQWKMTLL